MSDETTVRAIVERHAAAFARGDVPALLADYAETAVIVTKATGPLVGLAAIKGLYEMIFANVFPPDTTTVAFEPVLVSGDVGLLHWSATTPTARTEGGFDSFFIQNGKIIGQAGGVEFRALK